jgi:hypothetical protein
VHVTRAIAAVTIAVTALVGTGGPSLAECTGQANRFPDFTDVAPSATTVVIGTAVESGRDDPTEPTAVFSLRVDAVIRGQAPAMIDVDDLRSGLPRTGSDACRGDAALWVRVGDVIALALDGRLDGRTGINSAAWVEGRPHRLLMPAAQVLSRRKAIAAARALPATDTEPAGSPRLDARALVVLVLRAVLSAWADMADPTTAP